MKGQDYPSGEVTAKMLELTESS